MPSALLRTQPAAPPSLLPGSWPFAPAQAVALAAAGFFGSAFFTHKHSRTKLLVRYRMAVAAQ